MIRSYVLIVSIFFQLVCISQEILHPHDKHFNFLENKGQWPEAVLFKAPFSGGNLWIQQNKFVFHLQDFSDLREIHNDPAATKEVAPILKQTVVHLGNGVRRHATNLVESALDAGQGEVSRT